MIPPENQWRSWYDNLSKPSWTPSSQFIGTVWSILYPIILFSFGFVFLKAMKGEIPKKILLPLFINLGANLAFSPIQFGLKNLPLAALDILTVLGTIVWIMIAIWPYYKWVALAQIPYLTWVLVATTLQIQITLSNL